MHTPFFRAELDEGDHHDEQEKHNGAGGGRAKAEIAEGIKVDGIHDDAGAFVGPALG